MTKQPDPESEDKTTRDESQIGGSDAPTIFGVDPYRTAYELWHYKCGVIPRPQLDSEVIQAGHIMEPVIAKWFADAMEVKIRKRSKPLRHKEHPWMGGHIDREILSSNGTGVLECKNTGTFMASDWGDELQGKDGVPDRVLMQALHYAFAGDYAFCAIAVCIGGNRFRRYLIDREEHVEAALFEAERIFWFDHVQKGRPPAPDYSHASTLDFVKNVYDTVSEVPDVPVTAEDMERLSALAANYDRLKLRKSDMMAPIKAIDATLSEITTEVRDRMREMACVALPDGTQWIRKQIHRKPSKASSYVKLSRKA